MRLIVVDDEKWVRLTIKKLIPCERLGLTIAAEASNGLEALELCKQYKPHIVITDIRMPGLSGLELIQELKQILPATRIIIISGYNDFVYAKTAMKFGVTDYLLKPVDEKELTQVLQKLKDSILLETKELEAQTQLRDNYKNVLPLILEEFLNQLIVPNLLTTNIINNTFIKYGLHFDAPDFMVVVFSPDCTTVFDKNEFIKSYKLLIKRIMFKIPGSIAFSKSAADLEMIVIINYNSKSEFNKIEKAVALCLKIYKKRFSKTLSAGISETVHQVNKLPELYIEATEALGVRFWAGMGEINYYHKNLFTNDFNISISSEVFDKMILSLIFSNYQPILEFIEETLKSCQKLPYVRPQIIKENFWTLIQSISSKLNIYLSFIELQNSRLGTHPYERLRSSLFSDELRECLKDVLQAISEEVGSKNQNEAKSIIENSKRILEQNYAMDISLEYMAKQAHLNQTYFSELFKKEEGVSFIDYKTNLRIENAKELLATSNLSINEISSKVGYSDSKYFGKLFKKVTGNTFSEFREIARKANPD